jgi:hypothetical protein
MSFEANYDDADLPSYNEVVRAEEPWRSNDVRISIGNEVYNELSSLAVKFDSIQCQKFHQLQQNDEKALSILIPHVKSFLVEYSKTTLPTATLILIPAGSINPLSIPADDDLRSPNDFGRVIRVTIEKEEAPYVWNGEGMAERIANYLRPCADDLPEGPSQPNSPSADAAPSKKSFWRKKSAAGVIVSPLDNIKVGLPKVTMVVKVEEIVFRVQSELGLYETQSLRGIVIKIRVNGRRQGR